MTDTFITRLPFPGFYESILSEALDNVEANEMENMASRERESRDGERYVADPALRLKADDLYELPMQHMDYGKAHTAIAKAFVDGLNVVLSEIFGFEVGMTFESMVSPREYNFGTDRVFAYLPVESAKRIHAMAVADPAKLAALLAETYTSYDGFASHYSNALSDWLARPMDELDHNEWCTLIEAAIATVGGKIGRIEDDVLEILYDANIFDDAFDKAMDWPAFDLAIEDMRADKLADIREYDPDYVPAYFCPVTPDLFADY